MKRNLFRAVALMAALLCVPAQPAQAQVAVYDAANYVKNTLTELHTLQIVTDQATQIANQLQQIDYQVQSLRNFPNGIWGQIQGDLQALTQIAKVGPEHQLRRREPQHRVHAHVPGLRSADELHASLHAMGEQRAGRHARRAAVSGACRARSSRAKMHSSASFKDSPTARSAKCRRCRSVT